MKEPAAANRAGGWWVLRKEGLETRTNAKRFPRGAAGCGVEQPPNRDRSGADSGAQPCGQVARPGTQVTTVKLRARSPRASSAPGCRFDELLSGDGKRA